MSIPFTQYLRPDGEKRSVEIDRPADIETMARQLIADGARFEIEELTTLEISMTCDVVGEEDFDVLAHEVCQNGPPVLDAVDRLVRRAFAAANSIP